MIEGYVILAVLLVLSVFISLRGYPKRVFHLPRQPTPYEGRDTTSRVRILEDEIRQSDRDTSVSERRDQRDIAP